MAKKPRPHWSPQQARQAASPGAGSKQPVAGLTLGEHGEIIISSIGLPPPTNVYDADYSWARFRNNTVSLFFAKSTVGDAHELASRLEVRMAMEAFVRLFWRGSVGLLTKVTELIQKSGWAPGAREIAAPEALPSKKEHSVWASLASMARHGTVMSIDFYHIAPDAIVRLHRTKDSSKALVEPTVRVLMALPELLRLLEECERIALPLIPILEQLGKLVGPEGPPPQEFEA